VSLLNDPMVALRAKRQRDVPDFFIVGKEDRSFEVDHFRAATFASIGDGPPIAKGI